MTNYIIDIGMEVHLELATRSKMFCGCAVVDPTTAKPNSAVCPVCCGLPGTLPVINKNAVALAMRAALALDCQIAHTSIFARKNYFYPDLPKGYQISQYEQPLAVNGSLMIHTCQGEKVIRVHRTHLEEDTGKLTHVEGEDGSYSLVDLNRAGVPLLEIVSEPDIHSIDEAVAYGKELRLLMRTIGVTSGDMEKGTMRFEANLSMRTEGCQELGTRVEVKNLNSFRAMEQALIYQVEQQRKTLEQGKKVTQQTLGWDESLGKTISQRSKENANDYRYFPEPDLPPLIVENSWIAEIRDSMPELPEEKRARYRDTYGLQAEDVERLTEEPSYADFFEACLAAAPKLTPQRIINWMLTDLLAWLRQNSKTMADLPISHKAFTDLIELVENSTINQNTGKDVLGEMLSTGKSAGKIIEERDLLQISDHTLIEEMIDAVLLENPDEVQSYFAGKETIMHWLFGQVMRKAKGKANPQLVKEVLKEKLDQRRH